MRERLARGMHVVMAGLAWLMGGFMIKASDAPSAGQVAIFAGTARFDVVLILAFSRVVIVAGETALADFRMIHMNL